MEYRDTARDFLGVGWRFPVEVDAATGRLRSASSEEDIQQAVRLILLTGKGERMMEPEFGCNIRGFLFGDVDYTTRIQMEEEVRDALIRWEPRITDIEVQVEDDPTEDARLLIRIGYVVRATNNPYNLVYPYYINEGLEN
jgi:phage baseplate assembly protein W